MADAAVVISIITAPDKSLGFSPMAPAQRIVAGGGDRIELDSVARHGIRVVLPLPSGV